MTDTLLVTDSGILQTSKNSFVEEPGYDKDWCTPPVFLDTLYKMGPIHLDPCSNEQSVIKCEERWTITKRYLADGTVQDKMSMDTFTSPWPRKGLIYANPPYGADSDDFLKKIVEEGSTGAEIVALVPARTDTQRWHKWAEQAPVILYWKGRISFVNPKTGKVQAGTKFPSAVLYWGPRQDVFIEAFKDKGSFRVKL